MGIGEVTEKNGGGRNANAKMDVRSYASLDRIRNGRIRCTRKWGKSQRKSRKLCGSGMGI